MNAPQRYLKDLIVGKHFSAPKMTELCQHFPQIPLAQQAALLALFSAKRETVEELVSAVCYLRSQGLTLEYKKEVVDIVGTGGDGCKTFNISTAASLVVASCGVKVAKHGGRAVTSQAGSADVLTQLKIPFYETAQQLLGSLDKYHYAFLWAPLFNPVLKSFAPLRRELGIPTLLNILGPLINPLRPRRQIVGVYREDLVEKIAQVLLETGSKHAMVVRSLDGMDEFSLQVPTKIAHLKNNRLTCREITPEMAGLRRAPMKAVLGGTPQKNAEIILDVFSGKEGPAMDIVLFNAAAGLVVADKVEDICEGVVVARQAITSGATLALLHNIQEQKL